MTTSYKLLEGDEKKSRKSLEKTLEKCHAYKDLAASIARSLKANSLESAELIITTDKNKFEISFSNPKGTGKISLSVKPGPATEKMSGTPYRSNWNGYFYRLPHLKKKPYAKNGQEIKRGDSVGIVFVSKNEQFVLSAPGGGRIYFPTGDKDMQQGLPLKKGETVLFYLD